MASPPPEKPAATIFSFPGLPSVTVSFSEEPHSLSSLPIEAEVSSPSYSISDSLSSPHHHPPTEPSSDKITQGTKCFDGSLPSHIPSPEEPSLEKPSTEGPSTEEPSPEEPSPEKPSPEKPSPEKPSPEEPSPEGPSPEEPSPEEPSTEKPSPEEPSPEKPSFEKQSPEEPSPEEPSPEEPSTEGPSPDEPSPEGPSPEGPSTEDPSPEEPSPEEPSPEKPSLEKPSPEKPSPEKPSSEKPSFEKPSDLSSPHCDNGEYSVAAKMASGATSPADPPMASSGEDSLIPLPSARTRGIVMSAQRVAPSPRHFLLFPSWDPEHSWISYEETLAQFFVANSIQDEKRKLAVLLSYIGRKGYDLVRTLCAPSPPTDKTYNEVCALVREYRHLRPPRNLLRYQLNARQRRPGESLEAFVIALVELASQCQFGESFEERLTDRFISCLDPGPVQDQLLLAEEALTLGQLLRLAHLVDVAQAHMEYLAAVPRCGSRWMSQANCDPQRQSKKQRLLSLAQEFAELKRQFVEVLPFDAHRETGSPSSDAPTVTSGVHSPGVMTPASCAGGDYSVSPSRGNGKPVSGSPGQHSHTQDLPFFGQSHWSREGTPKNDCVDSTGVTGSPKHATFTHTAHNGKQPSPAGSVSSSKSHLTLPKLEWDVLSKFQYARDESSKGQGLNEVQRSSEVQGQYLTQHRLDSEGEAVGHPGTPQPSGMGASVSSPAVSEGRSQREEVLRKLVMPQQNEGLGLAGSAMSGPTPFPSSPVRSFSDGHVATCASTSRRCSGPVELFMNEMASADDSFAGGTRLKSRLGGAQGANQITEEELVEEQERLQAEATLALAQARPMAHHLLKVEKKAKTESPVDGIFKMVGITREPGETFRLTAKKLAFMRLSSLQVLYNALRTESESLNEELMKSLMERDDLFMQQDALLVDTEDLGERLTEMRERRQAQKQAQRDLEEVTQQRETKSARIARFFRR